LSYRLRRATPLFGPVASLFVFGVFHESAQLFAPA
jgi:hypothetical protein